MSQSKLAATVDVIMNGIHYVLNALIDKGLVRLGNFTATEDKRRNAYILTPKGITRKAALTRAFLVRKMEEHEALKKEVDQLVGKIEDNTPILAIE